MRVAKVLGAALLAAACGQVANLGGADGGSNFHVDGTVAPEPDAAGRAPDAGMGGHSDVATSAPTYATCTPGAQLECGCSGAAISGVQVCNPEGTGYGPCQAGHPTLVDAASLDAGPGGPVPPGGGGLGGPPCQSDDDCPAYMGCYSGACNVCYWGYPCAGICTSSGCAPCAVGANNFACGSTEVCLGGTCTGCSSTSQCTGGLVCVDGNCVDCSSNAQCGPGAECTATHTDQLCTCSATSDCTSGSVCVSGYCTAPCCTNNDCQSGQVCSGGVCGNCDSDDQCGPSGKCQQGNCTCTSASE